MDAVSPILAERAREPQGLRNMWMLSLVVHGVAAAMLLMMPAPSLEDDSLKNAMTISLAGAPGVRTGGLTSMAARTAEAAPDAAKAPQAPAATKVPEMAIPTKKELAKPTPSKAANDARNRPTPKALEATRGDARIETSAKTTGFGLTTGGGGGTSAYLDITNFCCPEYITTMLQLIQRNWESHQSVAGTTRIKFTIQRDGRLTDVQLEQSSYFALDQAAQRAIAQTRQLPPLPAQFSEPTLTVHLNFPYVR